MTPEAKKLHVSCAKQRNRATFTRFAATINATGMQPVGLKALAFKVLECNSQCNQHATEAEKPCNFSPEKRHQKLHALQPELHAQPRGLQPETTRVQPREKEASLPPWCSTDCQYLDLAGLPGGQPASIPGCLWEDRTGGWVWSRLDKLNGCPTIRLQLSRLPAWCNRQCPHYHAALSEGKLVERCHWQDKTGRHWVRLRIEQLRHCPAKAEKSNSVKN